jgi:hypothetical protein
MGFMALGCMRFGLFLFLVASTGHAADVDHTRAMLYRVDAEARGVRLHPDQAWDAASEVARQADRVAPLLPADEALALQRETRALAAAARRDQPDDVRGHAVAVQILVRAFDERLPSHHLR